MKLENEKKFKSKKRIKLNCEKRNKKIEKERKPKNLSYVQL